MQSLQDKIVRCLRTGRARVAERLCRAALADSPSSAQTHHMLGLSLLQLDHQRASEAPLRRALRIDGPTVQILSDLGAALQAEAGGAEALRLYRLCAVLDPAYGSAYSNAGKINLDHERAGQALPLSRIATLINPLFADAWANRAAALLVLQRLPEAALAYRKSLCISPAGVVANSCQGAVLTLLDHLPEAERVALRALKLDARRADAHQNFANYLEKSDRPAEAAVSYRTALCLDPAYMTAQANLGTILQQLGQMAEAAQAYDRAIQIEPRRGSNYRQRVTIRQIPLDPHLPALMESLILDSSLAAPDKMQIHFALGDAYERGKDFGKSFDHYAGGSVLKRKSISADNEGEVRISLRTPKAFPAERFAEFKGAGHPSQQPIFLVGMPRSGSTLTEQILSSHPAVYGAGERLELGQVLDEAARRARCGDLLSFLDKGVTAETLGRIGADYLARISPLAPGALRITDKMPGNFVFAGLIHMALPNAKIIHCRRDPVDTSLSCFSKLFVGENQPWSYDLREIGRYYRAYETVMNHWRTVLPADVLLEVRYEDVIDDLEAQARRIIAHCGLEWDPRCLAFHENERTVRTASASQVRQPIYKSAVQRGQRYGDRLKPLLDALEDPDFPGYDSAEGQPMSQIKIDDVTYDVDALPEEAREHLVSLQFVDGEIQRLQLQLAMAQTARNSYATALRTSLKEAARG